jgi:hypothetical protein
MKMDHSFHLTEFLEHANYSRPLNQVLAPFAIPPL